MPLPCRPLGPRQQTENIPSNSAFHHSWQGKICKQIVVGTVRRNVQLRRTYQLLEPRHVTSVCEQVRSRRVRPKGLESLVVDENLGCAGSIGAVLQIVATPVEQQRSAIGVEEDRRESVVRVGLDQLSWRAFLQRLSQRIGAEISVKAHQRQPRSLEKDDHRHCNRCNLPVILSADGQKEGPESERNGGHSQWQLQICEGSERQVSEVPERKRVKLRMLHQCRRDIALRRGAPHEQQQRTEYQEKRGKACLYYAHSYSDPRAACGHRRSQQ